MLPVLAYENKRWRLSTDSEVCRRLDGFLYGAIVGNLNRRVDFETLSKEIAAGQTNEATFNAQGTLSSTDEIKLTNDAEITKVERNGQYGRKTTALNTPIYDRAEEVTITPPTGENKQITPWIIISISAMAVLAIGIIFIKKKILK